MKKKLILCAFSALSLVTAIVFTVEAVKDYSYNASLGLPYWGWNAPTIIAVGIFLVLYEWNWFFTAYYFLFKPKTAGKTVLNMVSHLLFVSVFACGQLIDCLLGFEWLGMIVYILFAAYVVFIIAFFRSYSEGA